MVELKGKDIESLNAVAGALHKNGYKYSTFVVWRCGEVSHFTVQIEEAPTVGAVEVVHGRWEKRKAIVFDDEMVGYRCSKCNTTWDAETNYCPNCGADMRERKENG